MLSMEISVIVPVFNEADTIRPLLDSLLNQSLKPSEIVITDGGSVDATVQTIDEYIRAGNSIRLIRTDGALPGRGRNLAASAANFEWLAFTDAGIRPAKNWLEALARRAKQDEGIDVVYGAWEPVTDSFFKECGAIAYVPPPAPYRPRSIASTLMRRDTWRSVGGFPEDLRSGEDLLFMDKVEKAGFHFVFEPTALVYWNIKPSFTTTFHKFVAYSRSNIHAGLWRQWQAAILSRYLILALLTLPGFIFFRALLWIPLASWLLMLIARAVVAIRRNRICYPAGPVRNLKRLFVLAPLIATLDLATISGSVEWLLKDSFRRGRKTIVGAGDGA
jgi:glycosyltransferase involved in cell wall biosynthesis